jgi:hypothetical protein
MDVISQHVWLQWTFIIKKGMITWNGVSDFERVYGMPANQITDGEDRAKYKRKRGVSPKSASDDSLWLGSTNNTKWPANVNELIELGTIIPGPYQLKLWHWLNVELIQRRIIPEITLKYGFSISMTTSTVDPYNQLPIANMLKSTIELNHTTLLGCLQRAFTIEWTHIHKTQKFQEWNTRRMMRACLSANFDGINGASASLLLANTNILTFNQMHHAWAKFVQIMISLPAIVDYIGNVSLFVGLTRFCGSLFTCKSPKRRKYLIEVAKTLFTEGMYIL